MADKLSIIAAKQFATERYIRSTHPVLYLPLYRLDGSPSIRSQDAFGHVCTVTGATWGTTGRTFGGNGDNIVTASAITLTPSAFTALVWWKRLGNSGGATSDLFHSLLRGINGYSPNNVSINKGGTEVRVSCATDSTTRTAIVATTAAPFHLVGAVWTGTQLYAVADGVLGTATAAPGALTSFTHVITLGMFDADNYLANGIISEALVYPRAFNIVERQRFYLTTKWRYK